MPLIPYAYDIYHVVDIDKHCHQMEKRRVDEFYLVTREGCSFILYLDVDCHDVSLDMIWKRRSLWHQTLMKEGKKGDGGGQPQKLKYSPLGRTFKQVSHRLCIYNADTGTKDR